MNVAQPDITLHLDEEGVIREASLSNVLADEPFDSWVGRPWVETVADVGDEKVRRMLADARDNGVSAFRQINQRFPSGLELSVEYTTVRVEKGGGLVAVGKNLQAVAELQSRLVAAQQAMEREYWKYREVETRYRLLFAASNEPVLLLKAANLKVVEANPSAVRALGTSPVGREFLKELAPRDRDPFQTMLARVRDHGKAPGILLHFGAENEPWLVRASLLSSQPGDVFLVQLTPVEGARRDRARNDPVSTDLLLERMPANPAFLQLVQVGAEASVAGERLARWLGRPGADMTVLLANIQRHGVVRLFTTAIQGELGTETEVEISAAGDRETDPAHFGVVFRAVGQRLPGPNDDQHLGAVLNSLNEQVGKSSLRTLVRDTVAEVERHYIGATLKLTGGNRTAAAEILGLSRQSLYVKLSRYGLVDRVASDAEES